MLLNFYFCFACIWRVLLIVILDNCRKRLIYLNTHFLIFNRGLCFSFARISNEDRVTLKSTPFVL